MILSCVLLLQMYKNSQLSLENINADKDIKNKVKEAVTQR